MCVLLKAAASKWIYLNEHLCGILEYTSALASYTTVYSSALASLSLTHNSWLANYGKVS